VRAAPAAGEWERGPRQCLKRALSSVADGAGAPAHRSPDQPDRPTYCGSTHTGHGGQGPGGCWRTSPVRRTATADRLSGGPR
jgi:hypothetical protein